MIKMSKKYKYLKPVTREELPKPTKRLPEYDQCLKEFIESGHEICKVNMDALPSKKIRVILSSLKWRIKHRSEFGNIKVFMRNNQIYLEKSER
jgi:hypothetical protein